MDEISGTSFSIESINNNTYQLVINFTNSAYQVVSCGTFIFHGEDTGGNQCLVDAFVKNAMCKEDVLGIFNKTDKRTLRDVSNEMKSTVRDGVMMFTLDVRDPVHGYGAGADVNIRRCEGEVCRAFQCQHPEDIKHKYFNKIRKLNPDLIFCEGRLKVDILRYGGFSPDQLNFLHSKLGTFSLCQLAEFFLNAFEFGWACDSNGFCYRANQYLTSISGVCFTACASTIVYYPAGYELIFSPAGEFFKTLSKLYLVNGCFNPLTKVTRVEIIRCPSLPTPSS